MPALDLGDLTATIEARVDQFERGLDRGEQRMHRFRNEVEDAADAAADGVDRELGQVDGDGLDRGLDRAEGRFSQWGEQIQMAAAAIGVAIGAALTAALVEAMELDAAQAELEAALGDEAYAKNMGRIAGDMYSKGWGEGIRDNMAAVKAVMASGLLGEDATDEQIQKTSTAALALAQVFEQDVTAAARAAGQMVRTGLAKDSAEAFDILTRGFQQTGDPAGDLLDTFSEYSTQFRKLGIDGTTAMGLLQQGLKAGARDLDIVADAFKEFSIRSIDGSKASAEGYKALGLDAEKMTAIFAKGGPEAAKAMDLVLDRLRAMKDPVAQSAAAVGLFGTQSEDLGAALYALDMDTAAAGMGDVAGAAEDMAGALGESASHKFEAFKRQVKGALVEQVAKAIPYMVDLAKWGSANKDWIVPLVGVLGTLAVVIGAVVAITKIYTAVQAALNVVMMMNPIGLIIIAIVALIAGFVLLYHNVEWFRDGVNAIWGGIVAGAKLWWDAVQAYWGFIKGAFMAWLNLFLGTWTAIFNGVGAAVGWIIDKWNAMVNFVRSVPGRMAAAGGAMWDWVKSSFRSAINWVIGRWNSLSFRIPGVSIPGIGQVWGGMTLRVPGIPYLDVGGDITRTGLAVVHAGERVVPAAQAERLRDNTTASRPVTITHKVLIEFARVLQGLREEITFQGGDVQTVLGGAP